MKEFKLKNKRQILKTVYCNGDMILSTNIDTTVIRKNFEGLEEGLYQYDMIKFGLTVDASGYPFQILDDAINIVNDSIKVFELDKKKLEQLSRSMSKDETRPFLCGLSVQFKNNRIVTTNGFTLCCRKLDFKGLDFDNIIISSEAINHVLGLMKISDKVEFFYHDENYTVMKLNDIYVVSTLIKREFPNINSFINYKTVELDQITINNKVVKDAIKGLKSFLCKNKIVRLQVVEGNIFISPYQNEDINIKVGTSDIEGNFEVIYSAEFLVNVLSNGTETIVKFNGNVLPSHIQDETHRIIMPCRI